MLNIGMTLTLEPVNNQANEKFKSRIVEMSDKLIYIDYPINIANDKTTFLVNGTRLNVAFTQSDRESYSFQTEVKGREKGVIPMVALSFPEAENIFKIQRRKYVRVEAALDVAVKKDGQTFHFVSDDLSAGGVSFILNKSAEFQNGEEMDLFIVLPMKSGENQYVKLKGKFVRTKNRNGAQIASVHFIEPTDIQQQQIMRYSFERQLSMKQKERVL
ncbi:flagellar brake protein [Jeotgalibacillus campisalis]|uniref:Glycosyltransferase n=1 Tax=Jeotgalibacillus campisalis TaxID=220754 RepID=A0A0C2RCT7_9BACL|nr:flagellar brake domain-containing protein [Jeotgalibacillus campisalis]KIL48085.1 hypothetical protein KR50_22520 [Jeotgalibacillus campisalis]